MDPLTSFLRAEMLVSVKNQTFCRVAVKYLDARMKSILSLRVKHLVNVFKKVCQTVLVILPSQDKLEMFCVDCWVIAENNRRLARRSRDIFPLNYRAFPPFKTDELTLCVEVCILLLSK